MPRQKQQQQPDKVELLDVIDAIHDQHKELNGIYDLLDAASGDVDEELQEEVKSRIKEIVGVLTSTIKELKSIRI